MDTILDELKEKYGAQLTLMFQPIDFSNISDFPNYGDGLGDAYTCFQHFMEIMVTRPSSMSNISFSWLLT